MWFVLDHKCLSSPSHVSCEALAKLISVLVIMLLPSRIVHTDIHSIVVL